jgi:hypothetical protein
MLIYFFVYVKKEGHRYVCIIQISVQAHAAKGHTGHMMFSRMPLSGDPIDLLWERKNWQKPSPKVK